MTQTDQMNEPKNWDNEAMEWMVNDKDSARSDEQAQSQDRERLQEDLQEAWDRLTERLGSSATDSDIKLLKWALGVK